ncbi:MAG: metalloregulator ArsR/SmtB family transcription factor [Steroidobacteraceae bacterium]
MDAVLQALADPIRRRILCMLGSAALPAGQIAQAFAVSRPAVSRHLRVLREAGLVRHRDSGRERMYQLELAGLKETEGFLAALRAAQSDERKAWERRFMALDTEVHRVHARSKTVTHRTNPVKKRKTA